MKSTINDECYYTVSHWMTKLPHVRGVSRDLFALIFSFNSHGQQFSGSISYIRSRLGCSQTAAYDALNNLISHGYVTKVVVPGDRPKIVYSIAPEYRRYNVPHNMPRDDAARPDAELISDACESATPPHGDCAPHNGVASPEIANTPHHVQTPDAPENEKKSPENGKKSPENGAKSPESEKITPENGHNNKDYSTKSDSESESTALNVRAVIDLFNKICKSYPAVRDVNQAQQSAIEQIIVQHAAAEIEAAFRNAEDSQFLRGENAYHWRAGFDWIIDKAHFTDILNGRYSRGRNPAKPIHRQLDEEDIAAIGRLLDGTIFDMVTPHE